MQQEQPPVCRCGYENPGNFCPSCGVRQPGQRTLPRPQSIADSPWKIGIILTIVGAVLVGAYFIFIDDGSGGGNDGIFSSPPPIHEVVTCREIADRLTLENDIIRKITRLSTQFEGQDRLECRGYADVERGPDEWVTLSAERDYEDSIHYFIESD